jgi:hypothetical protein
VADGAATALRMAAVTWRAAAPTSGRTVTAIWLQVFLGGPVRAVVPFSDLKPLVSEEILDYVGQSFPTANHDSSARTVIEIVSDEVEGVWKAGFYLVEKEPLHFEDSRRSFCKAAAASRNLSKACPLILSVPPLMTDSVPLG